MSIFYGFVIFCLFAGTSGHSRFRREITIGFAPSCPQQKTFSAFNETKYMGTWYSNGAFDKWNMGDLHCESEHWSAVQKGEFSIVESWIDESTGKKKEKMITARVTDSSKLEQFNVSSNNDYANHTRLILETDYISYTVQYICALFRRNGTAESLFEQIWIATRERNPPKAVIEKAMKFVTNGNLTTESYAKTNQTSCEISDEKANMDEGDENTTESQEITTSSSSAVETLLPLAIIRAGDESGNATLD